MTEIATERVWIKASPEVLQEMAKGWSSAVRIRAEQLPDGSWEMQIRAAYDGAGNVIDFQSEQA